MNRKLTLKEWSIEDRPREKMLLRSAKILTTNELLAILLRSGNRDESALDLSKRIMKECGDDLNLLAKYSAIDLMNKFSGIGQAKSTTIIAALELGIRRQSTLKLKACKIGSSLDAYNYISSDLRDLDHEEFWAIFLDHANNVFYRKKLSSGGMNSTVIDIRMLFKTALDIKAHFLIVAHNHPSGNLKPSNPDKLITKKIKSAGELIDVLLYDHIIVGHDEYFSFADEGLL